MAPTHYADRRDAGRQLAVELARHGGPGSIVLALPRGGVPVADEVARAIHSPLDVVIVRKLGVPWQPELAMGAIGEGGVTVVNDDVVASAGISPGHLADVEARESRVVSERATLYRCGRRAPELHGRTAILVDDGLATGATMRAACAAARLNGARHVVVAVPVAPMGWTDKFAGLADELVCPFTPQDFVAVGSYYGSFDQVPDSEVVGLLARAGVESCDADVMVECAGVRLPGHLSVPLGARGCVVFAHGSGSSRGSVRNRWVARRLNTEGFATLLFDLLTEEEVGEQVPVFAIELLARRLEGAVEWVHHQPSAKDLPIGLFGASTGAAAALVAAVARPEIKAVVSRGGRPDLAWSILPDVRQPVLCIVGARDLEVLDLNRRAADHLGGTHTLSVVAGAGHLFEEPGALDIVAERASQFFARHLVPANRLAGRHL